MQHAGSVAPVVCPSPWYLSTQANDYPAEQMKQKQRANRHCDKLFADLPVHLYLDLYSFGLSTVLSFTHALTITRSFFLNSAKGCRDLRLAQEKG